MSQLFRTASSNLTTYNNDILNATDSYSDDVVSDDSGKKISKY